MIQSGKVLESSRVLFVNDGSKDATWKVIQDLHTKNPEVFSGLNLSRNRGHQNALIAGLLSIKDHADLTISIDADLQDDVSAMDEMVDLYNQGIDIVYGVRNQRDSDSFFKRFTAQSFYKMMKTLGAETIYNHADYRLMSQRALAGLADFKEVNLFLRGLVPLIGFSHAMVSYGRHERVAGKSKYPLKKMLSFALDGITSLSIKPIRMISMLGALVFLLSILATAYVLIRHFTGATVAGWSSLLLSTWAIGGLVLMSLGVIGEYIAKIYLETKARPRFIIESMLDSPDASQQSSTDG
jgi:glycosyltransferase involved in cell wall biosynthesis